MWREDLLSLTEGLDHPAWGPAHSRRVYALSLELAGGQDGSFDEESVFAAAHLHDLGALAPYQVPGVDHAERSAGLAGEILARIRFPQEKALLVGEIIRHHMFSATPGSHPEAVLFRDADILDFLGAVGVARLLAVAGLDDWTPTPRAAIDLIGRFSRELPEKVMTPQAKRIALVRQAEMQVFLDTLAGETEGLKDL